jgi:hypothetical protein
MFNVFQFRMDKLSCKYFHVIGSRAKLAQNASCLQTGPNAGLTIKISTGPDAIAIMNSEGAVNG